jgi:uncharacterized membrane protein YgcG
MMTSSILRFRRLAVIAGLALSTGSGAAAQEKTPFPSLSDQRVYVAGVPDRYGGLADQITRLERSSPQTYYVVVVKSTGPGQNATFRYAEDLFDVWRSQASQRGKTFDPERSVIIVVGLDNHQVALHTGAALRTRFGLRASVVERELIQRAFIPLAQEEKYPEAVSALLDATNNWIAVRTSEPWPCRRRPPPRGHRWGARPVNPPPIAARLESRPRRSRRHDPVRTPP